MQDNMSAKGFTSSLFSGHCVIIYTKLTGEGEGETEKEPMDEEQMRAGIAPMDTVSTISGRLQK
jgi:hypothetical protein